LFVCEFVNFDFNFPERKSEEREVVFKWQEQWHVAMARTHVVIARAGLAM
jgi:hypothetical protein